MSCQCKRLTLVTGRTLVLATLALVYALMGEGSATAQTATPGNPAAQAAIPIQLPPGVAEMRDLILKAVVSGKMEDLREAVQWNELPPNAGPAAAGDPIAAWLAHSKNGGLDVLAALGGLLGKAPAVSESVPPLASGSRLGAKKTGPSMDGARRYIWPAASEKPPQQWTDTDEVALAAFLQPDEIAGMKSAGRYTSWRLVIGYDGTWHSFAIAE